MRAFTAAAAIAGLALIAGCAGTVPQLRPVSAASTASPSVTAAAALPVFKAGSYSGLKPSEIAFSGDGGNVVGGITWSEWTATEAIGRGTSDEDNCKPDCASGQNVNVETTITLSQPAGGVFTELVESRPGQYGTQEWQYPSDWAEGAEPANYQPLAVPHQGTASPSASTAAGSAWSVVSEFYGDVETSDYRAAWDLLGPAVRALNGTERAFARGYDCTGSQELTENSDSGDTVTFTLRATNTCDDAQQVYSGTATVAGGMITSDTITQTSGPS